jgi:hypothetical protein
VVVVITERGITADSVDDVMVTSPAGSVWSALT